MWRSKYGNRKVQAHGHTFDSMAEYRRYLQLIDMQNCEQIEDLEVHPEFTVLLPFVDNEGKKVRAIKYEGDFMYKEVGGKPVVEDVKGVRTELYRVKVKLFKRFFPGIVFREIAAKTLRR